MKIVIHEIRNVSEFNMIGYAIEAELRDFDRGIFFVPMEGLPWTSYDPEDVDRPGLLVESLARSEGGNAEITVLPDGLEPKDCPFCHKPVKIRAYNKDDWDVVCDNNQCPVMPELALAWESAKEAVKVWNGEYLDQRPYLFKDDKENTI
jgi:hypothetical protein